MNLIPSRFESNDPKLRAERVVFEKLKSAFKNDTDFIAFHSLNLTTHKYKREAEADFVILCPYGIYVLEVKGGGIKFVDGTWSTTDRYKKEHTIHSPFEQAKGALYALLSAIKNSNQVSHTKKLPIGYGVIFPDCGLSEIKSVEWERPMLADQISIQNFEKWLKALFSHWRSRPNNYETIGHGDIKKIKQLLRPNFEKIPSLYSNIQALEDRLIELSSQQYLFLDFIEANKRVLCYGGAGTGKTLLASEISRRRAKQVENVALICKSDFLASYLDTVVNQANITVSTVERIALTMKEKGIEIFDTIIVDEAQDVFNMQDLIELDEILVDGLTDGSWTFFHDVNNQSGLFSKVDPDALKFIKEECSPTSFPLNTNFRNTIQILNFVKSNLNVDVGNIGIGDGPNVIEFRPNSPDEYTTQLKNIIDNLKREHISPGDITILSPHDIWDSSLYALPEQYYSNIKELDSYIISDFPLPETSFSTIKDFKGIENKIVILIDLPLNDPNSNFKTEKYVGLSRARDLLIILWK